jgi:hypothetical protein
MATTKNPATSFCRAWGRGQKLVRITTPKKFF